MSGPFHNAERIARLRAMGVEMIPDRAYAAPDAREPSLETLIRINTYGPAARPDEEPTSPARPVDRRAFKYALLELATEACSLGEGSRDDG